MATRYAGDYFGVSLIGPDSSDGGSRLLYYYPELRSAKPAKTSTEDQPDGARSFRGTKAVGPFTGFKTLEKGSTFKAVPVFTGFKER